MALDNRIDYAFLTGTEGVISEGEQAQYNGILAELAAWLRRTYPPRACTRWQW